MYVDSSLSKLHARYSTDNAEARSTMEVRLTSNLLVSQKNIWWTGFNFNNIPSIQAM